MDPKKEAGQKQAEGRNTRRYKKRGGQGEGVPWCRGRKAAGLLVKASVGVPLTAGMTNFLEDSTD